MSGIRHVMNLEGAVEQLLHAEGQLLSQRDILLTPNDHRWRGDLARHPFLRLAIADIVTEQRAIIIERGGHRVWLAERGAKMLEVIVAEGRFLYRAVAQHSLDDSEVALREGAPRAAAES